VACYVVPPGSQALPFSVRHHWCRNIGPQPPIVALRVEMNIFIQGVERAGQVRIPERNDDSNHLDRTA